MKTIKFETYEMISTYLEGSSLGDEVKTVFSLGSLEYEGIKDEYYQYAWYVPEQLESVARAMLAILENTECIY